jgi:CRP/FNR family transcriptional regulator, cyclic AMP receptor protein
MKQINVKKGKDFLKEGDESSTAYILLSGKMEVSKDLGNGQHKVVGLINENSMFGELGLIDNRPRCTTYKALEDSVVTEIYKNGQIEGLVQTNPKALLAIIKVLSNRLRSTLKAMEAQEV